VRDRPVVVLGVSRSGTTLLKEMLDSHSELAIPTESYFIPQLWHRHSRRFYVEAFLDDLTRLARVREWGVTQVDLRLAPGRGSQLRSRRSTGGRRTPAWRLRQAYIRRTAGA